MGPIFQRSCNSTRLLNMRKYYRLVLVLVASLSCILMLVYHHKYSRLNIMFNIMNSFGRSRDSDSGCSKKIQDFSKSRLDLMMHDSILSGASWTEVFPHIHMYSTFWLNNSSHTFSFIDDATISTIDKLSCILLHRDSNEVSEPAVPVKVQLFQKSKNTLFVIVKCQPLRNITSPYGVIFKRGNESAAISLPVSSEETYLGKFSMCIKPLPSGFDDVYRTIEFLTYHHHIGVGHFIIYDRGISTPVKKLLLELAPKCNILVTLLPWNVPFAFERSSKSNEYFVDCMHRVVSRNYSSFVLKGDFNQFIVLKDKRNLTTLTSDQTFASNPSRLHEEKFCSEYDDDVIANQLDMRFITLLKSQYLQSSTSVHPIMYNVPNVREVMDSGDFKVWSYKGFPQKSQILPKHIGTIHLYDKCHTSSDVLQKNAVSDKYMWRFKNLFFKSKLYSLSKDNNIVISND